MQNNALQARSIGSSIVERIISLSSVQPNHKLLDNIDIISISNTDGSAVITLEWMENTDPRPILDFLKKVKETLIDSALEVKEQVEPNCVHFNNLNRITYRFRIWDLPGVYEYIERELVAN